MSIRTKLVVIILFVALVPLTVSALMALNVHQKAFDRKIGEIHTKTAQFGARLAQDHFDNVKQTLRLAARSIRWPDLSAAEREGALWLVYRQLEDIVAVTLLDQAGEGIGSSVYVEEPTAEPAGHPLASMSLLKAFAGHIPFKAAQDQGLAISEAFAAPGAGTPLTALAVSVEGGRPDGRFVVAVGTSLRGLCREISGMGAEDLEVFLVDDRDRIVCHSGRDGNLARVDPALRSPRQDGSLRFRDEAGNEILAALASVPVGTPHGWTAVVHQPASVAFAPSRRMGTQTLFWIGLSLIIALAAGLFLSRSITQPVRQLLQGAGELAKGNFGYRLKMSGRDELGRLSQTFNHMGVEIEKRDSEIRAWNLELKQRVEDRTRELKDLQEELLQSKKIAAVSSMGAGIAHEINNPLTAVLGLTQVLIAQHPDAGDLQGTLRTIENEARRIKGIVQKMSTLSEKFAGEGFSRLDINGIIDESIRLLDWDLETEGIEIERNYTKDLPAILGNGSELRQVFLHLLNNSKTAMPKGGRVTLSTSVVEGQIVKFTVADTGKGIAPEHLEKILDPFFTTKDDWQSAGLGLTVAFRIVEEHHGKLKVDSRPGEGTTVTINIPIAATGAYLK